MSYTFHERILDTSPRHIFATLKDLVDQHGKIELTVTTRSGGTILSTLTREGYYSSIFFHRMTQATAA